MPPANDQPDSQEPSSNVPEGDQPSFPPQPEAAEPNNEAPEPQDVHNTPMPAEAAPEHPTGALDAPIAPEPADDESTASESIPVVVSTPTGTSATPPPSSAAPTAQTGASEAATPAGAPPSSVPPAAAAQPAPSTGKSYPVTVVLSFLFGVLGIDRFYLGKIWTGLLKLITFGGIGFWYMYDLVITAFNKQTDKKGNLLSGFDQYKVLGYVLVGLSIVGIISGFAFHR